MTTLSRLRKLANSSHSQSFVSIEIRELKALIRVAVAARKFCLPQDTFCASLENLMNAVQKLENLDRE
jgi:hypothetical protein